MPRWIYRIERCETFKAPAMLEAAGDAGWELVGFQYVMQAPSEVGTFIFKKQKFSDSQD